MKYEIEIIRTSSRFLTIEVYADNIVEARELALHKAGNYEFPAEASADYQIGSINQLNY